MIEIYDDILSEKDQDEILEIFEDSYFPWYLGKANNSTVPLDLSEKWSDKNTKEYLQFTHMFTDEKGQLNSDRFEVVDKIIKAYVEYTNTHLEVLRVKANLQTQCNFSKEHFYNTPHTDYGDGMKKKYHVLLYYINDSDGDTFIFGKKQDNEYEILKQVSPKKGRFLLFDGDLFHSGRHPINDDKRMLININIIKL